MICLPFFCNLKATPLIAKLSDSEPPLVKIISSFLALMESAILCLAPSNAFLDSRPTEYNVEGLPNSSFK